MAQEVETNQAVNAGYYQVDVDGADWVVPERYQDLKPLGIGAFGTVL